MPDDIIDAILATAARCAKKTAYQSRDKLLTYAELETKIRRFAGLFRRHGAQNILIALPQGADAYTAMLGAALSGAFYTPVNVEAPVEKLRLIVRSLKPQIIVAQEALASQLKEDGAKTICVLPQSAEGETPLEGRGTRHEIAYIIFTSGTTGTPKGVMIGREALNHYTHWIAQSNTITSEDHVSQFANIGFDISVTDVYGAFSAGATLHPVIGTADRMFPARFVKREKITVWNSTPSVFGLMMRADEATSDMLGSLRVLHLCGEPLLPTHLDAAFAAVPDVRVQNAYGPTEATVTVTTMVLNADYNADQCRSSASIGPSNEGLTLTLVGGDTVDEGEIVISGPQIALGYWENPQETNAAFRLIDIDGVLQRAYFTGDWAERRNGYIFFKERVDHQVKVHGFRIELDEIALVMETEVRATVCVVKWDERLAAVIEGKPSQSETDLRTALSRHLDRHAVPEIIRWIDHIPRSANDKLDRRGVIEWLNVMEKTDGA